MMTRPLTKVRTLPLPREDAILNKVPTDAVYKGSRTVSRNRHLRPHSILTFTFPCPSKRLNRFHSSSNLDFVFAPEAVE